MTQTIDKQLEFLDQIREETNRLSCTIYTYCELAGAVPSEALVDSSLYLLKLASFCNSEVKRLRAKKQAPTLEQRELELAIR